MIDYYKTYKRFIGIKSAGKFSKQDGHAKNLERHHIVPKSLGGKTNDDNLVWLSEYDHCIAHFLLNVASLQCNQDIIQYSARNCVKHGNKSLVSYWNPLSKLKFEITALDGTVIVKTLLGAALYTGELQHSKITKQRTKNEHVQRILHRALSPQNKGIFKYFGMKWKIIF